MSGDKELRKAFEETATRNIKANVEHSNDTRALVRQLEEKVALLEGYIKQYDEKLEQLQKQITHIQTKVFSGGT